MGINIKIKSFNALKGLPRFVYVLAVIAALGMSAGLYRLYAGLADTTNLSTVFPWGLWISFDLTNVAFSGAAFTLSMLVYIFHMHDLHAAVRPTVLFGLLGYSSVLVILFFDLGRWDRFWHFLVYPNLSSALFEVSWCIAIYSAILTFEFSPVILDKFKNEKISKIVQKMTIGMVIAGITLSSMHQSSLGSLFVIQIHRLHPLWYSLAQPEFFLVSSMAAGISTIIIGSYVSIWMFKQTLSEKIIEKLGSFVPWIFGLYLLMKIGDLILGNKLGLLFTSGILSVLYIAELLLTLAAIIWFSVKKLRATRKNALNGALIIAAGIVLNRFDVTWFAMKSIDGATYFPSFIEIALLVGVTSGLIVFFSLAAHFFPVFSETLPVKDLPQSELVALKLVPSSAAD
ncbi:MAG: polysulfide reductase NrfD [Anaerolineales bacterium]|uniref:NrfD/PsrC family molybdoenzyme membrane anchor subunit n=1 Tax=Candidatus Villigracilis proximus TaxID=3140683 RepID=UPI003134CFF5|nr:polysulfide reductase NrfD [Anaerolineales bacterium]